ncbi:MAG: hypothetical protein IMW89_02830 [Ktedonobacteraceae bacterium]|nr:hypothetical protein [Ktedonobacteraceae bacterium]
MDQMEYQKNYKEQFEFLHQAGFTLLEIRRLTRLRQTYQPDEQDQAPADLARLRFVRWLVETGRLTDQLT